MSEVEKMNSSSFAGVQTSPDGLTETQRSAGWRCTMCDALAPEYERCCASCAMPSSIVGCVRAMWDEYNRDEQCDYTAINRLIEHAADLADPEGVWDLSSEVLSRSPAEGRAGNPVADEPLPTLQSQARRVEELEGETEQLRGYLQANYRTGIALEARVEELEGALREIGRRARSDGNRTFDDCIRDLMLIDDLCRSALSEGNEP